MCDLSIVIVNTNTRQLVSQCLESVYANPPSCDFEVIVVDNASTDGSCETIERRFPQVRLIRNKRNLGFSLGNNRGFEIARGKHIMLLNSDTLVLQGSLDKLLDALEVDPTVGVVAPQLIYPDGSLQMSYGPMPSLFVSFCSFFEVRRWVPQTFLARLGQSANGHLGKNAGSYVKWFSGQAPRTAKLEKHILVTGACMLIRDKCFRQVGTLDPAFFMYVDDADYCKRVYDSGWAIQYLAEATIVHIKGGTVGQRYRWTSPAAYFSVFHFMKKHRGNAAATVVKALALASLTFRLAAKAVVAPRESREKWTLLRDVARGPREDRELVSGVSLLEEDRGQAAD